MRQLLRIGSRESKLAVIQAEIVRAMVRRKYPDLDIEIVTMKTTGDMILNKSLDQIGGKGLFIKELDIALAEGRIDLSVHSLKDMPMEVPEDFPVFAYTKREDPRDVMIYKPGRHVIPADGVIATSSRRRTIQLRKLFPGCSFTGIRGNVQTRLHKLSEQAVDATVLAAAGLHRLQMEAVISRVFSVDEMVPAAGQGILAVQGSGPVRELLRDCLNDDRSEAAALAERQFIRLLNGGCSSPAAAYAQVCETELRLTGLYYRETEDDYFVEHRSGEICQAQNIGEQLAKEMMAKYE